MFGTQVIPIIIRDEEYIHQQQIIGTDPQLYVLYVNVEPYNYNPGVFPIFDWCPEWMDPVLQYFAHSFNEDRAGLLLPVHRRNLRDLVEGDDLQVFSNVVIPAPFGRVKYIQTLKAEGLSTDPRDKILKLLQRQPECD